MSDIFVTVVLTAAVAVFGDLVYRVVSTLGSVADRARHAAKGEPEQPAELTRRQLMLGQREGRPNDIVPFQ